MRGVLDLESHLLPEENGLSLERQRVAWYAAGTTTQSEDPVEYIPDEKQKC